MAPHIQYSEKYYDDTYEYRLVPLISVQETTTSAGPVAHPTETRFVGSLADTSCSQMMSPSFFLKVVSCRR